MTGKKPLAPSLKLVAIAMIQKVALLDIIIMAQSVLVAVKSLQRKHMAFM
jgi:hypothetical protein